MTGKIDKQGKIHIVRSNEFKEQFCTKVRNRRCGDTCIAFGEPVVTKNNIIRIRLCKDCGDLTFFELTDERIKA